MIAAFLRWVRYLLPLAIFLISTYLLFFGAGPYERLYEAICGFSGILFVVVASVGVFSEQQPNGHSPDFRPVRGAAPSKLQMAIGLLLLVVIGPAWAAIVLRHTQSPSIVFIPFLVVSLIGLVLIGYNCYLWLLRK